MKSFDQLIDVVDMQHHEALLSAITGAG